MVQRGRHNFESLLWTDPKLGIEPQQSSSMTEEEAEQLRINVVQLRRAYTDLCNRVTFAEQKAESTSDYVKRKEAEEIHAAITEQARQQERWEQRGAELVPYVKDVAKLPIKYTEKTFPYVTLPMLHTALFLKGVVRRLLSYVIPMDASHDGTRAAIHEAEQERQLINIVRLQRQITRFQRLLTKALRKNQDSLVSEVGKYTTENMIIAYALKDHLTEVGYKDVIVTSSQDKIFLHIEIYY